MSTAEKKVLLIGNGNHQFIANYARWLRKQADLEVHIDVLSYDPVSQQHKGYYDTVYRINDNNLLYRCINKLKGIRVYYNLYLYGKLVKKLPSYDICHFHCIDVNSFYISRQLKQNDKQKVIFSVWGSDMYRVKPMYGNRFLKGCRYADYITFTNKKSLEYFSEKYQWGKDNLKVCRFGLTPLENLKEMSSTRIDCKKKLNWNTEKLAITIGYNMAREQQHLKILDHFSNEHMKSFKKNIQLIIPITYGGTKAYKNQLLEKLQNLPFEYKIYDEFLDDQTIAHIRKASDIMIQFQITDQFSGSMQEYMFTRNVVITGSWLPYDTLKEKGAYFIEIDKVEDLTDVLPDVINNFSKYEQKTANNPRVISELSSWEKNIKQWVETYKRL